MNFAIILTCIQLINASPKWDTPNTSKWRRDAEADRHRVAGNCKFNVTKGLNLTSTSPSFNPRRT